MKPKEKNFSYHDGILIGNVEDKAKVRNPIARALVREFDQALFDLLESIQPQSLHDVGCGEGRLTSAMANRYHIPVRGTDIGAALIQELQTKTRSLDHVRFVSRSIYDLKPEEDKADVIVCCEVLEHLPDPAQALKVLRALGARYYIFSVPREQLWCCFNMLRGRYWSRRGMTPGHLNKWSRRQFISFLSDTGFQVQAVKSPLPWTMVLAQIKK